MQFMSAQSFPVQEYSTLSEIKGVVGKLRRHLVNLQDFYILYILLYCIVQ